MLRGGKRMTILSSQLVVGDIVDVKSGDKIPADVRVIHSAGFKVLLAQSDESTWLLLFVCFCCCSSDGAAILNFILMYHSCGCCSCCSCSN